MSGLHELLQFLQPSKLKRTNISLETGSRYMCSWCHSRHGHRTRLRLGRSGWCATSMTCVRQAQSCKNSSGKILFRFWIQSFYRFCPANCIYIFHSLRHVVACQFSTLSHGWTGEGEYSSIALCDHVDPVRKQQRQYQHYSWCFFPNDSEYHLGYMQILIHPAASSRSDI